MATVNKDKPDSGQLIPYLDLGGGLNTRKDPHALNRNELAASVNLWPAYDQAVSKRPGSVPVGTSGTGKPCKSLLACRVNTQTYLIEVKTDGNVFAGLAIPGSTFVKIGKVAPTALFVTVAQMFDPTVGANGTQVTFLCDGIRAPQFWAGPGTQLQTVATGTSAQFGAALPARDPASVFPITPQYVAAFGQHLFYSGEPSQPSAVYVSDPFYPQYFNSPAMQVAPNQAVTPGQYVPVIVGNNDGIEGGIITGIESLGSALIVFKECAIYSLIPTTLLGEIPTWQPVQVSNNRGNLSPRSLVAFDTFITFLAIDGTYATDGNTIWLFSSDVPTFFDSTLTGNVALIANRTTAIGVRHGTRLLLFFNATNAIGTTGVWFDFSKQSSSGNPIAGQIANMNVGGAVALTGAHDDGNFCWSDAAIDNVAKFGVGYSDLGPKNVPIPITVTLAGKADLFDDVWGPDAVVGLKNPQYVKALLEIQGAPPGANAKLNFQGSIVTDNTIVLSQSIAQQIAQGNEPSAVWGASKWKQMSWGGSQFFGVALVKMPAQPTRGHLLQFVMTESSVVPWIMIGYAVYANLHIDAF